MCEYLRPVVAQYGSFFVDKNRSTAIASILRFVSEFLQSILVRRRVLQSILVRRRVFAIDLSSSSSFYLTNWL